jgi:hypothetical protein
MKRFQAFALDIQKAYAEALSRQADPLVAAPDQFARSPPGLVQSRTRETSRRAVAGFRRFRGERGAVDNDVEGVRPKVRRSPRAFARETAQELHNQSGAEPAIDGARKPSMQP